MTKINENNNILSWIYKIGFFILLALPVLIAPPYFFPADWGKSIVFRSILAILSFIFIYQLFYKKLSVSAIDIKNNKIIWAMGAYFIVFLLASIFSIDPNFSFWGSPYRGGGFINFGFCFVYAILFYIFLKDKDWVKAWIVSISTGILVSGLAIIQYYGLFIGTFVQRSEPSSTMGNSIPLAIYLMLLSFTTLVFAIREKSKYLKIFYIFSLLLFLFTILISGCRAVYLGIVIGVVFFLLFYPNKMRLVKICLGTFIALIFLTVLAVNIHPQLPKILQNKITISAVNNLSIKNVFKDERFKAWKIMIMAIKDKPILGWGPENLSTGFDKYYDSKITPSPWWDRAHNIFLDEGVQAGILGILAQIALFIILFWQLQKTKFRSLTISSSDNLDTPVICLGLQSALIGYLVSGIFSLNTLSVDLILFLIIGYTLHLTTQKKIDETVKKQIEYKTAWWKPIILSIIFLFLIIFLWQYNFIPLQINAEINHADTLAKQKSCTAAFNLLDESLLKSSFLDSYVRMSYIETEKTCSEFYPENALLYTTRGIEILKEATKAQPLYTRYWIDLGELTTTMVDQEEDQIKKEELAKQVKNYFDKALKLAPKHQEIFTDITELEIVMGDYASAKSYAEKCIDVNPNIGDCYFYLGISEIYAKNATTGKDNVEKARSMGSDIGSQKKILLLSNAYGSIPDYQDLAITLEQLIKIDEDIRSADQARGVISDPNAKINPAIVQYYSTLAFLYQKMGQYDKARQEALMVLKLSPESEPSVTEFLKTLP